MGQTSWKRSVRRPERAARRKAYAKWRRRNRAVNVAAFNEVVNEQNADWFVGRSKLGILGRVGRAVSGLGDSGGVPRAEDGDATTYSRRKG